MLPLLLPLLPGRALLLLLLPGQSHDRGLTTAPPFLAGLLPEKAALFLA
jgi:hypothetical protein